MTGTTFYFTGSEFCEPRLTQLGIRFTKILNMGRAWVDLFNVFNANNASSVTNRYNPSFYPVVGGVWHETCEFHVSGRQPGGAG